VNDKIDSYGKGLVEYVEKQQVRRIPKPVNKTKPIEGCLSRSTVRATSTSAYSMNEEE
jgi:hypothetical protein